MGDKALLVVDGGAPVVIAPGETRDGVKLLRADGDTATVEANGRRFSLRVGDVPVNLGGTGQAHGGHGTRIVLNAVTGGHFVGTGQVNGVTVRFLVDTGASTVTFGAGEADRIGLDYKHGEHSYVSTANGIAPSYQVRLDSVRIDDVEVHGVIATVVQAALPVVLLGNTFLSRFQMKQENALLILDKRY